MSARVRRSLSVARLGPTDAARARANCALFWDMRAATDHLAAYLADPNCILLVAEIDREPVGQLVGHILRRWDSKGPMLYLASVDVAEAWRRRGVARELIHELLRVGRESGCQELFLITSESNSAAVRLYQSLGGTRAHLDDVLFEWKLAP